ncbi:MarR family transcriptional regulator [Streptomyces sp. DG2A-72]|uniref:MarR family winged helix-turn-helix transcriptional regulator n=1 Tax=Streptomyces sp. DG2A-72 TaxID=3051386 RepID=UPI00265BFC2B|nr:MarR family transcriptional regulator [Streptomyces sp. DG2A-72]MDO0934446.1 MarR family transcriptional regulator [Streptomyces sp. DG2A-72]
MSEVGGEADPALLQDVLRGFVRAFGLHQPERTPCGQAIPVSEAHALGELAQEGELRQVELGRRLRLEKSTVSRLVGQLAARGWVERAAAPGDGRGVVLRLTPSGQKAAHNLADARGRSSPGCLMRFHPTNERACCTPSES